jgi:hypothetical protein
VALAVTLHEAGYRVAVVDPRQAHYFAKAQLRQAKTDAPDARDLTQLAAAIRLAQWPVVVAAVHQHLDELVADLDRRIAALEAEIAAALNDRAWAESLACLASAPGIDLVTAAWPRFGTLDFALCIGPDALTACAGLAPVPPGVGAQHPRSVDDRPRRQRPTRHHAVLGHAQRRPVQPRHQGVLPAPARGWQAAQGGAPCRRPQAAPPGLGARCQAAPLRPAASSAAPRRCICPGHLTLRRAAFAQAAVGGHIASAATSESALV